MQIGIRVYKLSIFSNHKRYPQSAAIMPQDVKRAVSNFITRHCNTPFIRVSVNDDGSAGEKRSHRFIPAAAEPNTQHGFIRYGTFGYAADVEDINTGEISYSRNLQEADTIPLYYRFWWPDGQSYGLWAFQAYSGKSCARTILSEFSSFYRENFPDWRFISEKVVHDEIITHKSKPVKRLTLVKPRAVATSVTSALRPTNEKAEVDITLEVTAKGKANFGKLVEIKDRLLGNMAIDGQQYTKAFATVSVNGKPKKIGVVGVSSNTGVIDVSDLVECDPETQMPVLKSIAEVTRDELKDFAKRLGK